MTKKKEKIESRISIYKPSQMFLAFVVIVLLGILIYNAAFIGKIFPNTFIAGVNVSSLSTDKSAKLLSESVKSPEVIKLTGASEVFNLNVKDLELSYDYQKSSQRAFDLVRTGNILSDLALRLKLPFQRFDMGLSIKFNQEALDKFISVVAGQVSVDPVFPSANFKEGKLVINKGQKGTVLDSELLRARIGERLSLADANDIEIPLEEVDPTLTTKEEEEFTILANKYLGKSMEVKFEFDTFKLTDNQILSFLNLKGGFNEEKLRDEIFKIAQKINRDPQEPKFSFEGGKVAEFQPAKDGVVVDSENLLNAFENRIASLADQEGKTISFDIPVIKTPPSVTTDKVNNLGINELIGRGTSTYFHSIPGRVHNVSIAANKINGILVAPGETFSFNKALGDVSKFTGYKEAYVIQNGRTVLGDGGGVCQVSTTLFRSVLNAGLPIEERRAHAYRVGYYEQDSAPGIDATVFDPSPDFKFKNDTPAHILITAKADPKKYTLVFELYGTSDGRVASISKPVVSQVTAPPEDLYQDDPTLPVGTIKQVDYKAWGAKVSFNYLVTRNGEEIYKKTFISNYRPWQSVFLRGTAPAN